MTEAKAVFGLGNPGAQYHRTRHNVGFDVLDAFLASAVRSGWSEFSEERFKTGGQVVRVLLAETGSECGKKILVKPLTFMNLSGLAFRAVADKYHLAAEDCLIVCDDVHLEVG
ncbi:MAG: aminoacyl-tRNA hydrolase, partial [Candidatus Omnitrophica bacterium]|nr:aminoacyl-tRNA hydrolase [Candidatus Omnitrophota bacterium]